jgi:hypothetical protein
LRQLAKGFGGMAIIGLQDRLGFLDGRFSGYSPRYQAKRNSGAILIAIVMAHGLFIFIALTTKTKQRENIPVQPLLQLIQLQPENLVVLELEKPNVSFQSSAVHLQLPEIDITFSALIHLDLSDYQSTVPYALPNPNDAKYRDVFDPKLRQKLIDAQAINKPRTKEKSTSWTEIDGRTFVDMGNGECLVSMQKVDSRERGINFGFTRCGKTDSEKMMDNVTADLEARKHPLQTQ